MPPSYEIGPELSLKTIYECHYVLYKESNFVVNLNNECVINFNNLSNLSNIPPQPLVLPENNPNKLKSDVNVDM